MPSLDEILKKSKNVAELNTFVRKPLSIATEDRPDSPAAETVQNILAEVINKPTTNRKQSGNKLITNRQQTDDNLKEKPTTNWKQTDNKKNPTIQNRQQTDNATDNTTNNKVVTNWQQIDNKPTTETSFSSLVGLQRNIIIFIYQECKNSRSKVTGTLTLEHIAKSIECSTGTAKTTLQRLEKKDCLMRIDFKNGRGGWSRYELPESIYHDVLRTETDNKPVTKWQQTDNKVGTQPTTEPATNAPSSSSVLNIKETTTELTDAWSFDIAPYSKIGFTATHIKQLASLGTISAIEVEQSLVEFSLDLDNNALPQIKTNKLNFLMGLLRAGQSYVSEGYRNEQEAIISEMARRAEDRRKKLLDEKFLSWEAALNDEERKDLVRKIPTGLRALYFAHGISNPDIKNWLFNYFIQNVKGQ